MALRYILILLAVLATGIAAAQVLPGWAIRAGGPNNDYGNDCVTDAAGNTFVAGSFMVDALFGSQNLNSAGGKDIYVAKISPTGTWLWATRAGGVGADQANGIALDSSGNIIVCGEFTGTVAFGADSITAAGNSGQDIFVAKLSPSGQWLWARRGGGSLADYGMAVAIDASANVHLVGKFSNLASFGTFNLHSLGSVDIVVACLSPDGEWLWASQAGSLTAEYPDDIVAGADGNTYISGTFPSYATLMFGNLTLSGAGGLDIFVAALNPSGEWLWVTNGGGADEDFGNGIAISGNLLYVTGKVTDAGSFGTHNIITAGMSDAVVACVSTSGVWQWATCAGGTDREAGEAIAVDNDGRILVSGSYSSTVFTCGPVELICAGIQDVFVARLSPTGSWTEAVTAGGISEDTPYGLGLDALGNAYVTGYFYASMWFGDASLTADGDVDLFVLKVSCAPLPNDMAALSITGSANPVLNQAATYHVLVENHGTNAQSGYQVQLREQMGFMLAVVPGPLLAPGETADIELVWTPSTPGTYQLFGRVQLDDDQYFPNDMTPNLEVTVAQYGMIAGMVRTQNNAPLGAATVTCTNGTITESAVTGANGSYLIHLPAGTYSATASHVNYDPVSYPAVEVLGGLTTTLHFILHASPADDPSAPQASSGLIGCYPNPLRECSKITYSIPYPAYIDLSVYDLRGRHVATIFAGTRFAGEGYLDWDGRDLQGTRLPAGIYLCRMICGDSSSTIKLVLTR